MLKVKWLDENQYCIFRRYSMFFDLQVSRGLTSIHELMSSSWFRLKFVDVSICFRNDNNYRFAVETILCSAGENISHLYPILILKVGRACKIADAKMINF